MARSPVVVRPPVELVRPQPAARIPADGLQYSLKIDGWRAVAAVLEDQVVLVSRQGTDLSPMFPDIVAVLQGLPAGVVLDGELVAWVAGRMDFAALAHRRGRDRSKWTPASFIVFDLLAVPFLDLRPRPLAERWEPLGQVLADAGPPVQRVIATTSRDEAAAWYRLRTGGIEGIVARGLATPYDPRTAHWRKIRHTETTDAAVLAVAGDPHAPDALVVRLPDDTVEVTTRLDHVQRRAVARGLAGRLGDPDRRGRRPVLGDALAEVLLGTTRHGSVRFVRLRDDLAG